MKRLVLFVLVMGIAVSLFAQVNTRDFRYATGNWNFTGNRLYQNDANARLAKAFLPAPQTGTMYYEFNARYEGGAEDGHGGFGIHVFVDNAYTGSAWGAGRSYLLWLNYDERPASREIPSGLSAQVYRSVSNSQMELMESISLSEFSPLLTQSNLAQPVPFLIRVDGNSGEVRVYDPTDPNMGNYYYFFIDRRQTPLRGNWIAIRTNGMRMSFGQ